MEYLQKLQKFICDLSLFSGVIELKINVKNEFELFSGQASETWETQVIMEIVSDDVKKCPNIKIIGDKYDDINSVSGKILKQIEDYFKNI